MMAAAISSRVQPLTGRSCSAVLLVAMEMTASCVSGGKSPGPAGAGGVLKSIQTMIEEALTPQTDGMAGTVQFGGGLLVGRVVRLCGTQDDAAAQDEGLGRGAGADEGLEPGAKFVNQFDGR